MRDEGVVRAGRVREKRCSGTVGSASDKGRSRLAHGGPNLNPCPRGCEGLDIHQRNRRSWSTLHLGHR